MKKAKLSGSPRENVGKKVAAQLRKELKVPAVLYGGKDQVHFSVAENALKKLVYTPDVFQVELLIGDKSIKAVIQDLQFHPVTDRILHVDFLELFDEKEVKLGLPVRLSGNSVGVRNGGKLRQNFRVLRIKGLPGDIPEAVELKIDDLKIGDSIRVKDITLKGITILEETNSVVASVKMSRGASIEEEEAAEAEENAAAAAAAETAEAAS